MQSAQHHLLLASTASSLVWRPMVIASTVWYVLGVRLAVGITLQIQFSNRAI